MVVVGLLLAIVSLLLLVVQKTYYSVPSYELKRRARSDDHQSQVLYRAVAYRSTVHGLLWFLIGLSTAASFVLLGRNLSQWIGLVTVAFIIWWAFVWLPKGQPSNASRTLAVWVTPVVVWLVGKLHPFIERIQSWLPHTKVQPTDLYETEDLLELLEHQKSHYENRIPREELDAAQRILTFSHKLVRDVVLPRKSLKMLSASDTLGPVLLNELNESGIENYVVYQGKKDNVIGTLNLHDAVSARGGKVADVTRPLQVFVNETQSLAHVLKAFQSTGSHTFIVVNSFEEFVGIVTIEQVLREALGEVSAKDFDEFESRSAVATYQPVEEMVEAEDVTPEPTVEPEQPAVDEKPAETEEEALPPDIPEVVE